MMTISRAQFSAGHGILSWATEFFLCCGFWYLRGNWRNFAS